MQRPPPLNIGPIFIGAQPKPIDTIHIKRPPNDFSMNPHDRGLSILRQPYLSQRYDANKHFNAIVRADLVTTAELLKPIIAAEHQATIQMLPQALDIEIKNIVQSYGTSSALNSIEIKRHEKQAIDFLISKKPRITILLSIKPMHITVVIRYLKPCMIYLPPLSGPIKDLHMFFKLGAPLTQLDIP